MQILDYITISSRSHILEALGYYSDEKTTDPSLILSATELTIFVVIVGIIFLIVGIVYLIIKAKELDEQSRTRTIESFETRVVNGVRYAITTKYGENGEIIERTKEVIRPKDNL